MARLPGCFRFFFFNDTATTEIYTLSLHDALPISIEQAKQFLIKEGYQTPSIADLETKRGTSDPTYLVYTLGKLQILKLREDYRKMRGPDFSLLEFHNRLMQQGGVPLKIIRKAMLGDDIPTL